MKIKKYSQFIFESSVQDIESEWHSVGEYVEFILKDGNEDLKSVVNGFIKDVDIDIRISNAVNELSIYDKQCLIDQIADCINGVQKEPDMIANTDLQDLMESNGGRNIFNTFLKVISALGLKDAKPDWQRSPNEFIIYYQYSNLSTEIVKSIFTRFKSMSTYVDLIDYRYNECSLYFGIKYLNNDLVLEYGIKSEELNNPLGNFKLTQSILNSLITSSYLALSSFKSELVNIQYKDLLLLARIKNELPKFNPGYHEKKLKPNLQNGVLVFGYYGVGKWDNGKMDISEFELIKSNFKKWLLQYKWHDKILVNINYNSFWLYINIKNK